MGEAVGSCDTEGANDGVEEGFAEVDGAELGNVDGRAVGLFEGLLVGLNVRLFDCWRATGGLTCRRWC